MDVYVVKSGDTVYQIARNYGVSSQDILTVNQLANPGQLVVGQTLLIPTSENTYTIQPGDSFWSIAEQLGVSYRSLVAANPQLQGQTLYPGMVIQLPQDSTPEIIVNAYLDPSQSGVESFNQAKSALTYLSVFSYEVNAQGELTPPGAYESELLGAIRQSAVAPLMAITNIVEGQFEQDVALSIFNNQDIQDTFISNVLSVLRQKGYQGVNLDFEFIGAEGREAYNQFLESFTQRLHAENFIVSTALAPKISAEQTGTLYEGHDYAFHGQTVDFVVLMTYEWGWSGGPPMPVSPITQVENVIQFASSVMPQDKIVMSIPLYGYNWTLPYQEGGEFATAVSTDQAVRIALQNNVSIKYDEEEAAPYFRYTDNQGSEHIVWFEDLRTMLAMFQLVKDYNLGGINFWNLAFQFPAVWPLVTSEFTVQQ
ncbi:LysM peptidoglycan-binding domain-containing protein [Tuberibacillus sp. Marseille-P3662]|uniref:LysM peptidoglycan-binding domain-containing protein n=1 Tax=Tuberibacillus sp. Marseille-P3662 TaxID=1965358 RepID=UPI00159454DF|nr:LysM peptidoglycan-binding domain-containing protein [Tuberibacillus sp. Marseille-P3662]